MKDKDTFYATGRRKTSSARVYLKPSKEGEGKITVNGRSLEDYFPAAITQMIINQPFGVSEAGNDFDLNVKVKGGGISGQAGAVRHGISRALENFNAELRAPLKKAGLLTRDPRAVERKKAGRHKARKKPQFSKR